MASFYEQVVSSHRKTLDRIIERGSVERMKSVYERSAAEVLRKLERLGKGSTTFTAHHLRMTLAQLRAGQIYLDDQLLGELNAASREAQVESLHMLVRDYKRLEKHYTGHEPVVPLEEAARFAGVLGKGRVTLMRQHATSMKRYGAQMVGRMEDELGMSMAIGETLDGAVKRVHSVIGEEWWRAERVARTEVCYGVNRSHADGIGELAKEDPGLMSQWIEFCSPDGQPLDARVGVDSIAMMGQVAPPGGLFTMPATAPFPDAKGKTQVPEGLVGKSWSVPPCRPNGRESIHAWKKEWGVPGWRYSNGRRIPL
jgi:hypothetical protein